MLKESRCGNFNPKENDTQQQQKILMYVHINLFSDGDFKASLKEALTFATGASVPPPMGFDNKPLLEFVEGVFPKANTCVPVLYLPLGHHEFNQFKEKMDFGILNSPFFGYA